MTGEGARGYSNVTMSGLFIGRFFIHDGPDALGSFAACLRMQAVKKGGMPMGISLVWTGRVLSDGVMEAVAMLM